MARKEDDNLAAHPEIPFSEADLISERVTILRESEKLTIIFDHTKVNKEAEIKKRIQTWQLKYLSLVQLKFREVLSKMANVSPTINRINADCIASLERGMPVINENNEFRDNNPAYIYSKGISSLSLMLQICVEEAVSHPELQSCFSDFPVSLILSVEGLDGRKQSDSVSFGPVLRNGNWQMEENFKEGGEFAKILSWQAQGKAAAAAVQL
jgi:hypothetical protein